MSKPQPQLLIDEFNLVSKNLENGRSDALYALDHMINVIKGHKKDFLENNGWDVDLMLDNLNDIKNKLEKI